MSITEGETKGEITMGKVRLLTGWSVDVSARAQETSALGEQPQAQEHVPFISWGIVERIVGTNLSGMIMELNAILLT
jgi:hypothetical protein